ncbi:MAG: hypothetical protein RLZ68_1443, partial [Pseudomonadota bacterium]
MTEINKEMKVSMATTRSQRRV